MMNDQYYKEEEVGVVNKADAMPVLCEVAGLQSARSSDRIGSSPVHDEDVIAVCAASIGTPTRPIAVEIARELSTVSNSKVLLAEFPHSPKAQIKVSTSYETGLARILPHHGSDPPRTSAFLDPNQWLQATIGPMTEAPLVVAVAPAASDTRFPAVMATAAHVVITFPATFAGLRDLSAHMRMLSHLAKSTSREWQTICALPIINRNDPDSAFAVRLAETVLGPELMLPAISAGEPDATAFRHLNRALLGRCGFTR